MESSMKYVVLKGSWILNFESDFLKSIDYIHLVDYVGVYKTS